MLVEKQIEKIKVLTNNIKDVRLKIMKYEEDLKKREGELWLNSDWETLLNKNRPTEKDKTSFINNDKKVITRKRNIKKNKAELEFLKNNYEIELLSLKFLIENE